MRRFLILSCCTVLALALPTFAQRSPWHHERHWAAHPADPQDLVRIWYEKYLNRDPDPSGMATWVGGLLSGQPPEALLSGILSSAEYQAKAGNTPDGYVRTLFSDVVGREPSGSEFQYWMARLLQAGPQDVAYALLRRYPQSWQPESFYPDESRYEYRRPTWPYRR